MRMGADTRAGAAPTASPERPPGPASFIRLYRLNLVYRLISRLRIWLLHHRRLTPRGVASGAAWLGVDLATTLWLRRRWADPAPEPYLWKIATDNTADLPGPVWSMGPEGSDLARLGLDSVDSTINFGARPGHSATAADPAISFAAEMAGRYGLGYGLAIPAWYMGLNRAGQTLGLPGVHPSVFAWDLIAAFGGWGLAAHERYVAARLLSNEQRRAAARLRRSYWAGRASVALGADTVVDILSRTAPLLEPASAREPEGAEAWRAALVDDGRRQGQFLGELLTGWASDRNRSLHDLSAVVSVDYDAATGTTLLSPEQACQLVSVLESLSPRGELRVALVRPAAAGAELHLQVGDTAVTLTDPLVREAPRFDASTFSFAFQALWCASDAMGAYSGVPARIVAPQVAASLAGVGALSVMRRRAQQAGTEPDHFVAVVAGLAIAGVHAIRATRGIRNEVGAEGFQDFPAVKALWPPLALTALHAGRLGPARIAAVGIVSVGIMVVGLALDQRRLRWADLTWLLASLGIAVYTPWRFDEHGGAQVSRQVAEVLEALYSEEDAFAAGRHNVLAFARAEADRLAALAHERGEDLDERLAQAVEERLAEVRRRLAELEQR